MKLEWISEKQLIDTYFKQDITYKKYLTIKNSIKLLNKQFPTPLEWLNLPINKKIEITYSYPGFSMFYYILCWIFYTHIFNSPQYRAIILEYVLHPCNNGKYAAKLLAKSHNLVLPKEENLFKNETARKLLYTQCILLAKPFRDFTSEDVTSIPELYYPHAYSATLIQNIRIKLGYTTKIIKVKGKKSIWDKLIDSSPIGNVFKEYRDYLTLCNASKKFLDTQITALSFLYEYTLKQGYDDFKHYDCNTLEAFTKYSLKSKSLNTTTCYISSIKKFFIWGVDYNPHFPKTIEFPVSYWSGLYKKNKKRLANSDGRAFSEPKLANDIINIVYNFEPKSDIDFLCRAFWLVLGSCSSRYSFFLELEAESALQPLPNKPDTLGIYSRFRDKAGNKYGQFPILDKIGIKIIQSLQQRVKLLNLKPITNPNNNETYVHLFQLTDSPWILSRKQIGTFYIKNIEPRLKEIYPNYEAFNIRINAHGFRHHLLTQIVFVTGDIEVAQTAAGHMDSKMTREYIKSKVSKKALLFRVLDKYEKREITGNFYLRLVELLTSENTEIDTILTALSSEITIDQFILMYGKKLDIGYCFNTSECANWLKCWGCTNFLITKEHINQAITTLAHIIMNIKNMQKNCSDFTFENPMIKVQTRTIALIIKRLNELGITEEQITIMFNNLIHNKELTEGVINCASI